MRRQVAHAVVHSYAGTGYTNIMGNMQQAAQKSIANGNVKGEDKGPRQDSCLTEASLPSHYTDDSLRIKKVDGPAPFGSSRPQSGSLSCLL